MNRDRWSCDPRFGFKRIPFLMPITNDFRYWGAVSSVAHGAKQKMYKRPKNAMSIENKNNSVKYI